MTPDTFDRRYWEPLTPALQGFVDNLRQGIIGISSGISAPVEGPHAWKPTIENATNFFRLHSFGFLAQLNISYIETKNPDLPDLAESVVSSWTSRFLDAMDSVAWRRHQTAFRATGLALACKIGLLDCARYEPLLSKHGDWLANPSNYDGAWNHGLDQCIALLDLANTLQNNDYAEIATRRVAQAMPEYVDEEGVVSEQATHYAGYMYNRLRVVERKVRMLEGDTPPEFNRVQLIPQFLGWSTQPDDEPVPIGDTPTGPWKTVSPETLEMIKAESPESSTPQIKKYHDGWTFIRNGWKGKTAENKSLLTIRYGTFRRIHGHRDHMSINWFNRGTRLLSDPGFTGYSNSTVRNYELLEFSHNGTVVEGAGKFLWKNGTVLTSATTQTIETLEDPFFTVVLQGKTYEHAVRNRCILYIPELETILIHDWIDTDRAVTIYNHWLTNPNCNEHKITQGNKANFTIGDSVLRIEQFNKSATLEIASGTPDMTRGWTAGENLTSVPCPALIQKLEGNNPHLITAITPNQDVEFTWHEEEDPYLLIRKADKDIIQVHMADPCSPRVHLNKTEVSSSFDYDTCSTQVN